MDYFFENEFRVNSHDCDLNNALSPSGLMRCLQETANLHLEGVGCGYDFWRAEGRGFLLSRVAVTLHEPIFAYDRVVGRTRPCSTKGYAFVRCTRLYKNGRPAAELSSVWALYDFENQSLVKVDESGLNLPVGPEIELSAPLKFRPPKDPPFEKVGEFTVCYGVCDRNEHMNNTRYPDMLCGFLPSPDALKGKRISELSVTYPAEAHLGETLDIYRTLDPLSGAYFFRTVRRSDGKTNVEARMLFTDL